MVKHFYSRIIKLFKPGGGIKLTHWLLLTSGLSRFLSDERWTKIQYYANTGEKLNLDSPKTYNEKLQWLKLYYRDPLYRTLVDKRLVKEYVAKTIGNEYVIPTLATWYSVDEIDINLLPNQFVLKTNHSGGNTGIVICKDKQNFDIARAKRKLAKSLATDSYVVSREWPYKHVKRCIIAEPYMEDSMTGELRDYKFFCFDGEPKALFVATERQKRDEPCFDFFDTSFNHLDLKCSHPQADILPQKPISFDEMLRLARILSKGIPHVRVDLYEVNGKPLFGELTLYHWEGLMPFYPSNWNLVFGDWLQLPTRKIDGEKENIKFDDVAIYSLGNNRQRR